MNTLSLFNDFFGSDLPSMYTPNCAVPDVDVIQNKDSYTLMMDLPGRSENSINLELNGRVLTVSSKPKTEEAEKKTGEMETQTDYEKPQFLLRERHHTDFSRKFTLPQDIDGEKINAGFKNGVLTVNIPRKPAVEPRKIEIQCA